MKNLFIYLFILNLNLFYSQEYKLGKVTIDELKENEHKLEKDASACKIFSKAKTYMVYNNDKGFELVTEVENKIKIYKTDGLKFANFSVDFYSYGSDKEIVNFSDAVTYNLVAGKIEKTKLKSEGEFTERINKYNQVKKITMPNVKVGSIVEYKYTIKSPFVSQVKDWYFQDLIPVDYSSFQIRIPEYYTYNSFTKGSLNIKSIKNTVSSSLTINSKERQSTSRGRTVSTEFSQSKVDFKENISNFEIHDVPSIKEEAFVKNLANYIGGVTHELASIQYPNEPFKLLSTSWEEVAKNINLSQDFGGELSKMSYFEDDINKLLVGKNSDQEKMISIFEFVKNNFKWNGYFGIYTDEGLKNTYKNKIGNVADLNLLLTAILRFSKLNAHPVLISSVSNGIPLFPSRTAFNYVLAGVEIEGRTILLDATDKFSHLNILPYRAINWRGRMIYENGGSKEIDLEPTVVSKDNIIMDYSVSTSGSIQGTIKRQLTDYNAYNYRNDYGLLNDESVIEKKEKSLGGIVIDNYNKENADNLNAAVIESFDFEDNKNVEVIGDKIYISPLLFYALDSNPFKSDNRTFPIEFAYPHSDKYIITLQIPEGYVVDYVPETENLFFADKILSHRYIVNKDEKTLKFMIQDDVNVTILSSEFYPDLKEYYNKKWIKQNEKIVLKKKI